MSEPNIVMTRIDNRLIHGQVGNLWFGTLPINLVIVADDEAANDEVLQAVMSITADMAKKSVRFFTLQKTIDTIFKASPKQQIYIVTKTPQAVRTLVEGGVPIKDVNVGNMHFTEGKRPYHDPRVYVDEKDIEDFEVLKSRGINVFAQMLPGDRKIPL